MRLCGRMQSPLSIYVPRILWLDHVVVPVVLFWEASTLIHTVTTLVYVPTRSGLRLPFATLMPTFAALGFLDRSHFDRRWDLMGARDWVQFFIQAWQRAPLATELCHRCICVLLYACTVYVHASAGADAHTCEGQSLWLDGFLCPCSPHWDSLPLQLGWLSSKFCFSLPAPTSAQACKHT